MNIGGMIIISSLVKESQHLHDEPFVNKKGTYAFTYVPFDCETYLVSFLPPTRKTLHTRATAYMARVTYSTV